MFVFRMTATDRGVNGITDAVFEVEYFSSSGGDCFVCALSLVGYAGINLAVDIGTEVEGII